MAGIDGKWNIKTSLNLDASFDIPGMLSGSGKLSLSDIVAATIGETDDTAADIKSDTKNNIALVPDLTENSNSSDSISQFYPSDIIKEENAYCSTDISEFFSDNSNACDSFTTGAIFNPESQDKLVTESDSNLTLNCASLKPELKPECKFQLSSFKTAGNDNFDIDEIFSDLLVKNGAEQTIGDRQPKDQQVVPKLETDQIEESKRSEVHDGNYSTASFDSDLEDSIQFVEPDNDIFTAADDSENTQHEEPRTKRFRPSDIDSSTCPFPISNKSQNLVLFDMSSENSMPGDLNKSFSSKLLTPANSRSRSLSEACKRDESSPLGESRFNVSLTSLLGSPLSDSPLSNNPFFSDLKSILESDCRKTDYPLKLFDTLSDKQNQDVYSRERNLQARFSSLQTKYPDEVRKLSSFYRCQSAEVETERFKQLHGEAVPVSYRNYLNDYYDEQLHKIMDRVEKSVKVLAEAKQETIPSVGRMPGRMYLKSRPLLSRKAVMMMDEWYTRNFEHPYPSQSAVDALAKAGEISVEQVKKWFANKRNRCKNTRPQTEVANMKRKRQYSSRW